MAEQVKVKRTFVGRQEAMSVVTRLIRYSRLITICKHLGGTSDQQEAMSVTPKLTCCGCTVNFLQCINSGLDYWNGGIVD